MYLQVQVQASQKEMEEINGDRIDRFHASKLTEKQMDKVSQIKTHHLSGANYPTDNLSWVPEVFFSRATRSFRRVTRLRINERRSFFLGPLFKT